MEGKQLADKGRYVAPDVSLSRNKRFCLWNVAITRRVNFQYISRWPLEISRCRLLLGPNTAMAI